MYNLSYCRNLFNGLGARFMMKFSSYMAARCVRLAISGKQRMMDHRIQLVVADDHALFRTTLAQTLSAEQDIEVIGQGASAADAVALTASLAPDIVLLDLDMPGGGMAAAAQIAASQPSVKIVILTACSDDGPILAAQGLGARGYILKGVSGRELARNIRAVQAGACVWPAFDPPGAFQTKGPVLRPYPA